MVSKSAVGLLLSGAALVAVAGGVLATVLPDTTRKTEKSPFGTLAAKPFLADVGPIAVARIPRQVADSSRTSTPPAVAAPPSNLPQAQSDKVATANPPSEPTPEVVATVSTTSDDPAPLKSADPLALKQADAASPSAAAASPAEPARQGTLVDLNTASVQALNHLPGMGLIGRTIVNHRPYRTVQDLVDHRVLRSADFQRLRSLVTVQQ